MQPLITARAPPPLACRYECPDCRKGQYEHGPTLWRMIERLVAQTQAKRATLSPDLLRASSLEIGVQDHRARYNAAGAPPAQEAAPLAGGARPDGDPAGRGCSIC